jgi:hypothetical protein
MIRDRAAAAMHRIAAILTEHGMGDRFMREGTNLLRDEISAAEDQAVQEFRQHPFDFGEDE